MATNKELDDRLRKLEIAQAETKGGRSAWLTILSVASALAMSLAGWALVDLRQLDIQVASINTLLTKELPKIALSHAGSDRVEAAQSYSVVTAVLTQSAKQGSRLDRGSTDALASTLAKQGSTNAGLPQYWELASLLISLRSSGTSETLRAKRPNCLSLEGVLPPKTPDIRPFPPNVTRPLDENITTDDCVLHLDQTNFWETDIGKKVIVDRQAYPKGAVVRLVLTNAMVIYDGGTVIPITQATFINCEYQIHFPSVPPLPIRLIGGQLLIADLSKVHVDLTSS